jgi:hypothetical protein
MFRILFVLVAICLANVDVWARGGDWIILENCRLIVNPANDGDSFHASVGEKEYIFRLYLVDAPETDEMNPARLVEQAKYFAITAPQAIEVGQAAKEFTREKLSEPFTAFTCMSDASGFTRLCRLRTAILASSWFATGSRGSTGEARHHPAPQVLLPNVRDFKNSRTKRGKRKSEGGALMLGDSTSPRKSQRLLMFSFSIKRLGHTRRL